MKVTSFKFEGIDIPFRFITAHPDEASFLLHGKKQFFHDKSPEVQEQMLKEMYKTGIEKSKAAETAEKATKPAPASTEKDKPTTDKDKGNKTP